MSSIRFPGKVLASINGQPVIKMLIANFSDVVSPANIIVATSTETSDDPLACYVQELGFSVFRGPLHNVFKRFSLCLEENPCEWFVRVCADSPFLNLSILGQVLSCSNREEVDIVTNVFKRTFPAGQSVEMVLSRSFAEIDQMSLLPEEEEHVTKVFYNNPDKFRIVNIESPDPALAKKHLAIDTLEDLRQLEHSSERKCLQTHEYKYR